MRTEKIPPSLVTGSLVHKLHSRERWTCEGKKSHSCTASPGVDVPYLIFTTTTPTLLPNLIILPHGLFSAVQSMGGQAPSNSPKAVFLGHGLEKYRDHSREVTMLRYNARPCKHRKTPRNLGWIFKLGIISQTDQRLSRKYLYPFVVTGATPNKKQDHLKPEFFQHPTAHQIRNSTAGIVEFLRIF
jgi:hypothetical protein